MLQLPEQVHKPLLPQQVQAPYLSDLLQARTVQVQQLTPPYPAQQARTARVLQPLLQLQFRPLLQMLLVFA